MTLDELKDQDLKAYIASDSEGGEEDEEEEEELEQDRPFAPRLVEQLKTSSSAAKVKRDGKSGSKATTKDRTAALRNLLLAGDDDLGDLWGKAGRSSATQTKNGEDPAGDMEITFKPGLSLSAPTGQNGEDENMTTLEKYQLRMREKKARKKELVEIKRAEEKASTKAERDAAKAARAGQPRQALPVQDDFFGESEDGSDGDGEGEDLAPRKETAVVAPADEDGDGDSKPDAGVHADLDGEHEAHFSMRDILKAEKGQGKKRRRVKKGKNAELRAAEREEMLGPQGWKIDVKDNRFKALHEEAEFAIDPSNPQSVSFLVKPEAIREMWTDTDSWQVPKDSGDEGYAGGEEPSEGSERTRTRRTTQDRRSNRERHT